jgi:hypothetical protein
MSGFDLFLLAYAGIFALWTFLLFRTAPREVTTTSRPAKAAVPRAGKPCFIRAGTTIIDMSRVVCVWCGIVMFEDGSSIVLGSYDDAELLKVYGKKEAAV